MTSLMPREGVRLPTFGSQTPRFLSAPPSVESYGDEAIDFARLCKIELDPWQQLAVRTILAVRPDGRWAARDAALLVSRQNGKGEVLLVIELYVLFQLRARLSLHTAHEYKTSNQAFARLKAVVESTAGLRKRKERIVASPGQALVRTRDGCELYFTTRTGGAGRGFTCDGVLILDEAYRLSPEVQSALAPTQIAVPNPLTLNTSSTGFADSEYLWNLVLRGRSGTDPILSYLEWSAPDGADYDDPHVWAQSNPGLGYRLSLEGLDSARRGFFRDEDFAREHLGIWPTPDDAGLIDRVRWAQLADPESYATGDVIYALDVTLDHNWAALALAGKRPDGLMHVSVDDRPPDPGIGWVVPRCKELSDAFGARFLVDRGGPAWALVPELEDAGVQVIEMSLPDVRQADGMLLDAITEGRLRHRGQPDLDQAVAVAQPRPVGEGGPVFGRKFGEITSLNAAAFAHWWAVSNSYDVLQSVF